MDTMRRFLISLTAFSLLGLVGCHMIGEGIDCCDCCCEGCGSGCGCDGSGPGMGPAIPPPGRPLPPGIKEMPKATGASIRKSAPDEVPLGLSPEPTSLDLK